MRGFGAITGAWDCDPSVDVDTVRVAVATGPRLDPPVFAAGADSDILAASWGLIVTAAFCPLAVSRLRTATYLCSRSFSIARSGAAMKIEEYAPESSPTVSATP